eukprot:1721172-Amphidinium_carterae.1
MGDPNHLGFQRPEATKLHGGSDKGLLWPAYVMMEQLQASKSTADKLSNSNLACDLHVDLAITWSLGRELHVWQYPTEKGPRSHPSRRQPTPEIEYQKSKTCSPLVVTVLPDLSCNSRVD